MTEKMDTDKTTATVAGTKPERILTMDERIKARMCFKIAADKNASDLPKYTLFLYDELTKTEELLKNELSKRN